MFKIFLLISLFISTAHNGYAKPNLLEIHIKSDNIKIIQKNNRIIFTNNVIARKDDVVVLSDIMTVNHNKKKSDINNIITTGRIRISNQEFIATGDKGFYDAKSKIFTLSENVIFNNGASDASGEKFIYNFKTKKVSLINNKKSSRGKVKIILQKDHEQNH
jgi:lipopolysaccharide transport protein LptA